MPQDAEFYGPRLLIIKLSSFGDVIHALPTLEALRVLYPQGQITWLVEEGFAPLILGHPAVDEVWAIPRLRFAWPSFGPQASNLTSMVRRLRAQPFDMVIDLQGLLKSALWAALARSPRKIGYHRTREGSYLVLTEKLPPYDPDAHAVLRYLNVARHLGAAAAAPRFRLEHLIAGSIEVLGEIARKPYVVLHPGARWPTKIWPEENWARLAEWLAAKDLAVVLTGSPGDLALAEAVVRQCPTSVINLAGHTTMGELSRVLQGAAFAVTTDTGPTHLAAALGTQVVALFGPTAPWRTGPFGEGHTIIRLGLECSPCFRRECPEPRCLTELPVAMVTAACEKMLPPGQNLGSINYSPEQ